MSWSTVEEMTNEVSSMLSDALHFGYASCGSELQVAAVSMLADVDEKVEAFRVEARSRKDEAGANRAYTLRLFLSGVANFLCTWLYIKHDQMESAWGSLIDAQQDVRCGLRFLHNDEMVEVAKSLHLIERLLFPPQQFVSPSHIYDYATCTICGGVYGECGHVTGKLYMGEMCLQRPNDIRPDHVAIVNHPSDKGCRWVEVQRGKHMICTLTRRIVGEADEKSEHWKATTMLLRPTRTLGVRRVHLAQENEDTAPEIRPDDAVPESS